MVNTLKPGVGVQLSGATLPEAAAKAAQAHMSFGGFIEHLLPTNIIDAIARGDVLQIVIFAMILGFSLLSIGEKGKPIISLCESLSDTMFKFTGYIMLLAPLGVGATMAVSVSEQGWQARYLALALFVVVCLLPGLSLGPDSFQSLRTRAEGSGHSGVRHGIQVRVSLPSAMASLEKMGIPRQITSFVLPMGYSFNLDGSTLYLALASVFIAQVAGINLPLSTQLLMMLTLMLTSKGVAAVPREPLSCCRGLLRRLAYPEGIALILAVDTFMDMARTAVNLFGNCLATAVVARWEGVSLVAVAPMPEQIEEAVVASTATF